MYLYNFDDWEDRGTYYVSKHKQGSEGWLKDRKFRLTASNVGTVLGHNTFKTPEEFKEEFIENKQPIFSEKSIYLMNIGTKTEPIARKWYEDEYECIVEEMGLVVRKDEPRLGASIDGIINDKLLLEIKCPLYMYKIITQYEKSIEEGITFPRFYHNHIWNSHYDQMQTQMWVLNKKECDYLVYGVNDNLKFVYRVEFNEKYWNEIFPTLIEFLDNNL